jgi:hypothetical protein
MRGGRADVARSDDADFIFHHSLLILQGSLFSEHFKVENAQAAQMRSAAARPAGETCFRR